MNKHAPIVVNPGDGERLVEIEDNLLRVRPLGAGQEVGRSCIYMEFKGKKILLDCGIHPGLNGMDALPFVDMIDTEELDLLLISHFHLDHCGALPWFLKNTAFKGQCFMTHSTKAIYRWLLADCIKVSNISTENTLYTESDLQASMDRIETINFHEEKEVNGVRFWCYNAGHVLGAAMFMIEIAGVKILYTGDFSRQEDRHLMSAEIPAIKPDVLIIEATYGTHIHEKREEREARFTGNFWLSMEISVLIGIFVLGIVYDTVTRGGRCLIPVFALGRAQELLLILDEYWSLHPELHEIPIYYASSLAKKCMAVYQTYVNAMNSRIRRQIAINNPFVFKHISNLKSIDHFEDVGPCVVMASPGMMQSGLSRELFESWCGDRKNCCIIAGYCVEGTLAKYVLSEPEEIPSLNGQKLPRRCQVEYISFSAHTDYRQTSEFIRILRPPNIILVHGESNEMNRLKLALMREYEDSEHPPMFHNPKNTVTVELPFKGEKIAKVMGSLAIPPPTNGHRLSGILVKRNFSYHLLAPSDLHKYTDMNMSSISQKLSVPFDGGVQGIKAALYGLPHAQLSENRFSSFNNQIILTLQKQIVTLEWQSSSLADMYADSLIALLLKHSIPSEDLKSIESISTNPAVQQETEMKEAVKLSSMDSSTETDFINFVLNSIVDMFGVNTSDDGQSMIIDDVEVENVNDETDTKSASSDAKLTHKVLVVRHEGWTEPMRIDLTAKQVISCHDEHARNMLNRLFTAIKVDKEEREQSEKQLIT